MSPILPLWKFPEFKMASSKACAKNDDIAKRTGAEVENALSGTDASDLKACFRQALYFSTPPLILYRIDRPGGYSNSIFGVPLVDLTLNEEKVPEVMRMCIEEVEKRGLNIDKIYSVRLLSWHVPVFRFMLSVPVTDSCTWHRSTEGQWNVPLTNLLANAVSIQLLRRFENEKSFSFTSTDDIHSVATLLKVS